MSNYVGKLKPRHDLSMVKNDKKKERTTQTSEELCTPPPPPTPAPLPLPPFHTGAPPTPCADQSRQSPC